jgi:hypothetical protein
MLPGKFAAMQQEDERIYANYKIKQLFTYIRPDLFRLEQKF